MSKTDSFNDRSRRHLSRRAFMASGVVLATTRALPLVGHVRQQPRFGSTPFTLGVASGDPSPDGAVLWTRLAPEPLNGGGMPDEAVEVLWEVADDERMSNVVQNGSAIARPELGHTVHVELEGLQPHRWYWYRFRVGREVSRIGRTRTLPEPGASVSALKMAFVSCQHYETGYFTAYRHMLQDDLDLVFHLGDYIYEYGGRDGRVRKHPGGEIELLRDYRDRYALYRLDPDLQAAHAQFPFVVTWDDHEVDNNYASDVSEEDGFPAELFLRRRAEAYQAYFEHMPLRRSARPLGPRMELYRHFAYGNLASFFVLDTRQYRSDQPCGDRTGPACADVNDPTATLLGPEQERWLMEGLDRSRSQWNVLPQQVMLARVDRAPGVDERISMDQWSGYEVARRRLMEFLAVRQPANPVVLTGDIHSNWVNDLKVDYREGTDVVATEFVGTSVSSGGDGADLQDTTAALLAENPSVQFYNGQRGYVRCTITPENWTTDYRVLEYVSRPGSPVSTRASFVVESGRPGARQV
ncbi:MAG: alkaline phosphatase [Acidobacteria bacterium]|nr:alkaline phosphatase [Acidobacteriota bacterium]